METTLDLPIQAAAEQARAHRRRRRRRQARACSRRPWSRWTARAAIRAYVGGADYAAEPVRPRHRRPAPGRLGLQALRLSDRHGGRPHAGHPVVDEPVTIGDWTPRNYTGRYLGPITLRDRAGAVDQHRRRAPGQRGRHRPTSRPPPTGWASPRRSRPIPSMALGAVEVSPLEMAQAYDAFSNGGYLRQGLRRSSASAPPAGRVLYDHGVGGAARRPVIGQPALAVHDPDDAPGDRLRHRHAGARSRATTWPARPAPPATTATPGSSATPAASPPRSGSGKRRQHADEARSPAAARRPRSGAPS